MVWNYEPTFQISEPSHGVSIRRDHGPRKVPLIAFASRVSLERIESAVAVQANGVEVRL